MIATFGPIDPDTVVYRVNISNAAVLGLREDLDIVDGMKYNTALTIFFVPYVIFEIPSNILLKKWKPHVWCTYLIIMPGKSHGLTSCSSVGVHVLVWPGDDLPGLGVQLGWSDDYSLVSRYAPLVLLRPGRFID